MIDVKAIITAVASHAADSGLFDAGTLTHEPRNPVLNGLLAAVLLGPLEPYPAGSGLGASTVVQVLTLRLYSPLSQEPYDAIDPALLAATAAMMAAYSGDFELGGVSTVRNIDLLGESGTKLRAAPGYITQDGKIQRVMNITIPVIVNDAWGQS